MNWEKVLLIFILLCLVWLALSFGSHLPDEELRNLAQGTTPKGYQVLGVRCGFLFLAFLATLFFLDQAPQSNRRESEQ